MRTTKETNTRIPKENGITLIALVITIIVMLILVAVTISMAVNGGLFEYAQSAGIQTNGATANEQLLASGQVNIDNVVYNSIDEYVNGTIVDEEEGEPVPNPTETFSAIYETNTLMTEGNYTAMIPKGFAVGTSNGINTIAGGLVITDEVNEKGQSIGNEFVWIPVTVAANDTETSIASFYRSNWVADYANGGKRGAIESSYNEPLSSGGYTNEQAEYNEMLKSVYQNKGFYIGRYEAGIKTTENPRTATTTGSSNMVVQRDCYPYNYVGWGPSMTQYTGDITYYGNNHGLGAVALSKALYQNKDVGVTSTLCYGVQWDAMLDFIKDANHNVTNSTEWGNYYHNAVTIDRATARWTSNPTSDVEWTLVGQTAKGKTASESILLTTGASDEFEEKNIFDVAGNCSERTNEGYKSMGVRVYRGGDCYDHDGKDLPASDRSDSSPDTCSDRISFRCALYITNE